MVFSPLVLRHKMLFSWLRRMNLLTSLLRQKLMMSWWRWLTSRSELNVPNICDPALSTSSLFLSLNIGNNALSSLERITRSFLRSLGNEVNFDCVYRSLSRGGRKFRFCSKARNFDRCVSIRHKIRV